jgi:hypothetical protein
MEVTPMNNNNWFHDLFIQEAKAAKEYYDGLGGESINNQDKTITENGTYTADEGYTGLGTVSVDVPEPVLESLSVAKNGTYTAQPGVDGYSQVTVNVTRDDQADIEEQFIRAIERDSSKPVTKLPDGLTKIGNYAFETCGSLAITELPTSITSIGDYAFRNCINMTLDSLPTSITSIGSGAFNNCSKITITSIPEGVTKINNGAFGNCHGIREFTFPAGVKSVDNFSLSSSNLSAVTFKGKPTTIGSSAFYACFNPLTINVPWAEGEVANAPWGATNATINYNYTGG